MNSSTAGKSHTIGINLWNAAVHITCGKCAFHKFYCLVDELMKTMKTHFPRILWTTKFHIIHTNQTLLWNLLFNQVVDGLPLKGMSSTFHNFEIRFTRNEIFFFFAIT